MLFAAVAPAIAQPGQPDPDCYADPSEVTLGPTPPPVSQTFTVAVMVENLVDAYTLGFDVYWDPNYLNLTDIFGGDALTGAVFMPGGIDYSAGYAWDIALGLLGAPTGQDVTLGSIAILEFTCVGMEAVDVDTVINITGLEFYNSAGERIEPYEDSPYDCVVHIKVPPPQAPIVEFTWTPLYPVAGEVVTFTATLSPGFDGNQICPIANITWDFENDGIIDKVIQNPGDTVTVTHTYSSEGIYTVNATVYAPPGPSPSPLYNPWNWTVHDVMVRAPAVGRAIDLYTEAERYPGYTTSYTGEGAPSGSQVDSYAPQENVVLYAKVTYNGAPVCNKEVSFEVHGPPNDYHNVTIYRQAFTNCSGIATINFTIPWPFEHAKEIVFGNWTIMAKVSITEETVEDHHWFLVGWIINIDDVETTDNTWTPKSSFVRGVDTVFFRIYVTNLALTPRYARFTFVIYDNLGVPIGEVDIIRQVPAGATDYTVITIPVPEWAYVGLATVYVNAFSDYPRNCGICWCPEYTTSIMITA